MTGPPRDAARRRSPPPRLLILDCLDTFVETLARYARLAGAETAVVRCDAVTVREAAGFDGVILSPGPGRPEDAGVALDLVAALPETPIFGVCLGHQVIAQAYGGAVVRTAPRHGRDCAVRHDGSALYAGIPSPFRAGRYHSLIAGAGPDLVETAWTDDGAGGELVMGLAHRENPHHGVQFHPESLLTEGGERMVANFVGML